MLLVTNKKENHMKLTLTYKSVFGRASYYPADETSRVIALVGGFKSFTTHQVETMKKEGWEVDIKGFVPS